MKNPNRIVAYAIAVLGFLVALLPVVAAADWKTMAGAIAGLTAAASVAIVWLKGWQENVEKPEAHARLLQFQAAAQAEEVSRAAEAAAAASAPRGPKPILPR